MTCRRSDEAVAHTNSAPPEFTPPSPTQGSSTPGELAGRVEAWERERVELMTKLAQQGESHAAERAVMEAEHGTRVKELTDRLASEQAAMLEFRDGVRRQFEERHLKVIVCLSVCLCVCVFLSVCMPLCLYACALSGLLLVN